MVIDPANDLTFDLENNPARIQMNVHLVIQL